MPVPEQLGPYVIGRRLGRGGMGTVYAAVNQQDQQPAAVKVLAAALSQDDGFRDRFEAEVESLRKLRHPHIVRLYGFGEQDGLLFYAMELVEGRSLEEELAGGRRFDWRDVTYIAIQTCRALRHAHDRGIIHRDIKPANLMLNKAEEVKLSDFGIAKLFGASGMTIEGGIIGTAEFMAPEQADGRAATERTDLYSLGGVMYALLARRPPFRARTLPEMLQLQRFAEPDPVRRYAPDTPPELEKIIAQLLAKEPEKRLANAAVVIRRLEGMLEDLADAEERAPQIPRAIAEVDIANAATLAAPENGQGGPNTSQTMEFLPGAPSADADQSSGTRVAVTAADVHVAVRAVDDAFELAPTIMRQTTRVFKTVEEADQEDAERDEESTHAVAWQTAALAATLLSLGLLIWWLLQPPDAASLMARVEAASGSTQGLASVEEDIDQLLSSQDFHLDLSDRARLQRYQEEIAIEKLERQFEREARRVGSAKKLTPIERAYVDAVRALRQDEAAGADKLDALIKLFGTSPESGTTTQRILELARRQRFNARMAVTETMTDDLRYIESRLSIAADLRGEDPEAARDIYAGILELYADKPWAAETVRDVNELMASLPPKPIEDEAGSATAATEPSSASDAATESTEP